MFNNMDIQWTPAHNTGSHKPSAQVSYKNSDFTGLENCTRPLVFTSGSWVRASGNFQLLARQDE